MESAGNQILVRNNYNKNNITAKLCSKDLGKEWLKVDKQRLATDMAVKSPDVYNYLSSTPYQGRHKDERMDIAVYHKTTTRNQSG